MERKLTPIEKAESYLHEWVRQHAGEQLPPELTLTQELGVSRHTLRTALKKMEASGLIECVSRRQGRRAVERPSGSMGLIARTVIVVGGTGFDPGAWSNPGSEGAFEAGVMEALKEAGYYTLMMGEEALAWELKATFMDHPPLALIGTMGTELVKPIQQLHDHGVAIMLYGDNPLNAPFDRVYADQEEGTRMLVKLLVRRGKKRILRLWTYEGEDWWIQQRNKGYKSAMEEAGLEVLPPELVPRSLHDPKEPLSDRQTMDRLSHLYAGMLMKWLSGDNPVDGILCGSDPDAYAVNAALKLHGLPPQQVDVCGFDNVWTSCQGTGYAKPPIATIDRGNHDAGRQIVNLLLKRTAGQLPTEPQAIRVVPQLIPIDSQLKKAYKASS